MRKSDLDASPRLPVPGEVPPPIPVICDLCRARGEAGADPFESLGDLLRFTPVQRRARADGWGEEYQRAFIAALAVTGSPRRAARAIGKHEFGAQQLRKARGGASFAAAWDAAIDLCRERELAALKTGLADLAAEQDEDRAHRRDLILPRSQRAPLPSAGEGLGRGRSHEVAEGEGDDDHNALAESLFRKYLLKVQQERTARLAGKVVEADLYLRQLTFFEVALDLAQDGRGVDTWAWLASLRRDGHDLFDIARTPFSRFLDEARRMVWEGKLEQPDRPEPTAEEYFLDRHGYSLEPQEGIQGGPDVNLAKAQREMEERWRKAAMEQAEWEAGAQSVPQTGEHADDEH